LFTRTCTNLQDADMELETLDQLLLEHWSWHSSPIRMKTR